MKIPNGFGEKEGKLLLKAGFYKSNTIITKTGFVKLTDTNGISPNPISLQYLMPAGMRRIESNTI